MSLFSHVRADDLSHTLRQLSSSELERRRERLYDDPPPPYSSGESTAFPSADEAGGTSQENKWFDKTKPRRQYLREVIAESRILMQEECGSPGPEYILPRKEAYERVRQRWKDERIWNSNWDKFAGGFWRHEEDPDFRASRPRYRFSYEVERERECLKREQTQARTVFELHDLAIKNVTKRWHERHIWDDTWDDCPGDIWKHERLRSKSQERYMEEVRRKEREKSGKRPSRPCLFGIGLIENNTEINLTAQEPLSENRRLFSRASSPDSSLPPGAHETQRYSAPATELVPEADAPSYPRSPMSFQRQRRRSRRQGAGKLHEPALAQKSKSKVSKRADQQQLGKEPRRRSTRKSNMLSKILQSGKSLDIMKVTKTNPPPGPRRSRRIAEKVAREQQKTSAASENKLEKRRVSAQRSKGKSTTVKDADVRKTVKKPKRKR